jgi:hypothetical protein
MSEKIRPTHLHRTAYGYVRQSSHQQVRYHQESQRRQYALADRARALGFGQVVIIDEDLGDFPKRISFIMMWRPAESAYPSWATQGGASGAFPPPAWPACSGLLLFGRPSD